MAVMRREHQGMNVRAEQSGKRHGNRAEKQKVAEEAFVKTEFSKE